jgi:hypothetical protein
MKKMHGIILGLIAAAGALSYCGCSKFLDKQPQAVETSQNFFQTEDQAMRATIAVYDAASWQHNNDNSSWWNQWMLGDIVSDDAEKGGEGPSDVGELQQLKEFKANPSNSLVAIQWAMPYRGIYRANLVIDNVSDTTRLLRTSISDSLRARLVGEAKFLRAWFYFILVKSFSDVPLVLHPLTSDQFLAGDACQARTSQDSVWKQIEKDLFEAASVLPEASMATDPGRATKGAANALLVKAYIYQAKFAQAEPLANTIINSGQYRLESKFENAFINENGPESIFEIQYMEDPANSEDNADEGELFTVIQGMRDSTYFTGWGFDCPTANLDSAFEPGDKRRNATIIHVGDTLYKGTPAQQVVTSLSSPTHMNAKKYLLAYEGDEIPDMQNAPNNWREIRFADLLLFHAEAANENGNQVAALVSLNKVRSRAGLAGIPAGLSKDSLRTVIYHERRVELALEGQRFFDVIREDRVVLGRAAAVLGPNFKANKNEVFAVPQIEIDVCGKISQNHGY